MRVPAGSVDVGQVAYTLSRFPKISETFILGELDAVERRGVTIELCPLRRERVTTMHPRATVWLERAKFFPMLSVRMILSHCSLFFRSPATYLTTLWAALWLNRSSPRLLLGALATWPRAVAIAHHLDDTAASHLHCHFATHPALAGFVVERLVGIPFSFTAHGSDIHRDQTMLREKVEAATFVVAISGSNRAVLFAHSDRADHGKIKIVHCGVDLEIFKFVSAITENTPHEFLEVVCVGTLHAVKGQRHLIEAVASMRSTGVEVRATLVGDGPDRAELERLVSQLGLNDRVIFAGRRTQPDVVEFLRRSHVLVAPSVPTTDGRKEGIPVVLMEAMASGLPVVASRLSGIPELVHHDVSGLLVEPGDVDGIAASLRRLGEEPDTRRRLAVNGRSTVEADFDLDRNAAELVELFRRSQPSFPTRNDPVEA